VVQRLELHALFLASHALPMNATASGTVSKPPRAHHARTPRGDLRQLRALPAGRDRGAPPRRRVVAVSASGTAPGRPTRSGGSRRASGPRASGTGARGGGGRG